MVNIHYVITVNDRDAYSVQSKLTESVVKRMRKGLPVSREVLASCSTMRKITAIGSKLCRKYGDSFTKEDVKDTAYSIADSIIEEANQALSHE